MSKPDNRLVVITGAGSGIGRATALRFARRGAIVIASDIDEERAQETVALIKREAGSAVAYRLDVADPDAWEQFAETTWVAHGAAEVIVNNAGYSTAGSFFDHADEDWDNMLAVNVLGVIQGSRVFAQQMINTGTRGNVINIASGAAYIPVPLSTLYSVSKTAVLMASECLRAELAPHGVGVTAICPGFINTSFFDVAQHVGIDDDEAELRRSVSAGLAHRVGHSPDLVAKAVVDASRRNPAVRPVGLESHIGYLASRVSPGAIRLGARFVTADNLSSAAKRVLPDPVVGWLASAAPRGGQK